MYKLNKIMLAAFASLLILASCSEEPGLIDNQAGSTAKDQSGNTILTTTINRTEAQQAVTYLNQVRANPSAYSSEIGADLSYITAKPALRVDSILTRVAESRAADMATRNYFGHVNPDGYAVNYLINRAGYTLYSYWLRDPRANYFESIAAAYSSYMRITGIQLIKNLILDRNVASLGHRNHLLGVGSWNGSLVDIGIGFATNPDSRYKNYMSVIIAKHR